MEICFFEDCDLKDTSLSDRPKIIPKMFLFYHKIDLLKLPPIAKVMENQKLQMRLSWKYDFVFTNLLKNEADM